MLFLEKEMLGSTYVKLLVALAKISTKIHLYSLSNVSLRSRNSKLYSATSLVNCIFLVLSIFIYIVKKSHTCEEGGAHLRISFWHLLMTLTNK